MSFRPLAAAISCGLFILAAACSRAPETRDPAAKALVDHIGLAELQRSPEQASFNGLTQEQFGGRFDNALDDRSIAAGGRARTDRLADLQDLESFDRSRLTPQSLRSLVIAESVVRSAVDVGRYGYGYVSFSSASPYVINQSDGAYSELVRLLTLRHRIATRADADAWLTRLRKVGDTMEDQRRRFEVDIQAGAMPPRSTLERTLQQVRAFTPASPRSNLYVDYFYGALSAIPDLTEDEISRLVDEAVVVVRTEVIPAYAALAKTLDDAMDTAPTEPGVWRLPHGDAYYADILRFYTSTDLTPKEVHEMGEALVVEISTQMDAILDRIGMDQGSVGARMQALSVDPARLYPDTDEGRAELLADMSERLTWAEGKLGRVVSAAPKGKVTIGEAPAMFRATAPGGYYKPMALDGRRAAVFNINLRSTAEWPKWSLPTLVFHETLPGHHLQAGLQREARRQPPLQLAAHYPAFSEGWGVYAEDLADELGAYENDPEGRLGYLQSLLFRAARLVVDTGIHSEKWTRQQALDYLVSTTGLPRSSMETEVDRYIAWPGQACAYMIGREKIRNLRADSDTELGPDFDLKAFHSVVLGDGARPLSALESDVDDWVASKRKPAAAPRPN